jgi:hypothetical protein
VRDWVREEYPQYDVSLLNNARSGNWPWSNVVRMSTLMAANPDIISFDGRPAGDWPGHLERAMEAFIRRAWTERPTARLRFVATVAQADLATYAANADYLQQMEIAAHYGIPVADGPAEFYRRVYVLGHDINLYYADVIHPTVLGQQVIAGLLETIYLGSDGQKPAVMPAYLYADTPLYEYTPSVINGTAYTGITGSWTTTGTRIESSDVGATVTYTLTCASFGAYRADGGSNSGYEISIDGGAYNGSIVLDHNGYPIAAGRASHTIAVRIKAGGSIRIDQFWTI